MRPSVVLYLITGICIILSTTGCHKPIGTLYPVNLNNKGSGLLANYNATQRGTTIIYNGTTYSVLSEVQPDAIVSNVTEILGKLNYSNGVNRISAESQVKIAESVTELGRRTAAVNILRDSLYRLSEMRLNGDIKDIDAELFKSILDAVTTIVKAEALESQSKVTKESNILYNNLKNLHIEDDKIKSIMINSLPSYDTYKPNIKTDINSQPNGKKDSKSDNKTDTNTNNTGQ